MTDGATATWAAWKGSLDITCVSQRASTPSFSQPFLILRLDPRLRNHTVLLPGHSFFFRHLYTQGGKSLLLMLSRRVSCGLAKFPQKKKPRQCPGRALGGDESEPAQNKQGKINVRREQWRKGNGALPKRLQQPEMYKRLHVIEIPLMTNEEGKSPAGNYHLL